MGKLCRDLKGWIRSTYTNMEKAYGNFQEVPKPQPLKTTNIYFLTSLESISQKLRCQQGCNPLRGSGRDCSMPFSQLLVAAGSTLMIGTSLLSLPPFSHTLFFCSSLPNLSLYVLQGYIRWCVGPTQIIQEYLLFSGSLIIYAKHLFLDKVTFTGSRYLT